jgi:YYY domain-containing protein
MAISILQWWLVIQILGLIALPLTMFLFRFLPDRGYAFSKTLGLLLTGYGAWLLAMLGLGSFGVPLLLIVMLVVACGSGLLWRAAAQKAQTADRQPVNRFVAMFTTQAATLSWRRVLAYEIVFLVALLAMATQRATFVDFFAPNPNPWHTERPMDFAFFNAIQRSTAFPPSDPWLAGFSINYYYFGYMLMAIMTMLSGVAPGVGYNLSLALIFALTALGIAGISVNLIDLTLQRLAAQRRRAQEPPRGHRSFLAPIFALLGVVLVLLAGNQVGALQVIVGSERVVALDGRQLVSAVTQAVGGAQTITLPYQARTSENDFGSFYFLERSDKVADFNWWWPSRALWDAYEAPTPDGGTTTERRYTITEFPFFSFWLGDMHPHVMALPFGLLAMALALTTLARPTATTFALSGRGWLELFLTGVVLGSLYTINSWDLPTYTLLYFGALALLYLRLADGRLGAVQWRALGQQIGLAVLALFVLFAPFYLTFHSLVGFAQPLIDLPIIGGLTRTIAPYAASKSGLHAFLVIFGLFIIPLIAFVYLVAANDGRRNASDAVPLGLVARFSPFNLQLSSFTVILSWLPPVLLLVGLLIGFPLLAPLGLGLFALSQAVRCVDKVAESFVLLVVVLGCAICFGVELIYIRDVFGNRMNTIFKFYYQVWLLWGVLAAYALWWMLSQVRGARRIAVYTTTALFVLLLAGSLVYPAINLRNALNSGQMIGLEGRTPREETPAGREAIAWLRDNAAPGSVILEMVGPDGGSYNGLGFGGVSASSGVPTILGWAGHQRQWRGGDEAAWNELTPRQNDVELIYGTTDVAQAQELLAKYKVTHIYVGGLERQHYAPESLAKFDQIAQPVFQRDEVTIYQLPS